MSAQSNPETVDKPQESDTSTNIEGHDTDMQEKGVQHAKDTTTCSICSMVFNKDEYLTHFKVNLFLLKTL